MENEHVTIPESLEAAYEYLRHRLDLDIVLNKKKSPDELVTMAHHGIGQWIRNHWGLWQKTGPLWEYLSSLGLWHPDDMSGVILKGFICHIQEKEFDIQAEVKHYERYWEEAKKNPPTVLRPLVPKQEKKPRKIPNGMTEIEAAEMYQSYLRGWKDATGIKLCRPEFENHEKDHIRDGYNEGFQDGYDARRMAMRKAERITGHKPTVLRAV
jgi:hypothetical protein